MASSELLARSRRLMISPNGSLPCGRWPEGPCFQLRILLVVPPSVPRRTRRRKTIERPSVVAFARMRGARRPRLSHLNRNVWAALSRLQSSLYAAARRVACPSPTRTFTFELSFHESPHQNVEYNYAGKSSISRGRTYTGWTRSLTGCTAFRAALSCRAEIIPT